MNVVEELATFLAGQPTAISKLLAQHADNGRGRCQRCGAGAQQGFQMWPCTIHAAATLAAAARSAHADFEKLELKDEVRPLILRENAVRMLGL